MDPRSSTLMKEITIYTMSFADNCGGWVGFWSIEVVLLDQLQTFQILLVFSTKLIGWIKK